MQLIAHAGGILPALGSLFDAAPPIPTRLWAMLDGLMRSRALVDEPSQPETVFLQDPTEGTIFMGGRVTRPLLEQAIATLRGHQEVLVCLWPEDPRLAMLPGGNTYRGVAIDFSDRSPDVDPGGAGSVPAGFQLVRIDAKLAPRIEGFDYYVKMFGSLELALQHTIGYCLMQDDQIACESIAGPLTRGVAEMGVETAADFRGRGLATCTAACVIRECEALGYRAFWNAAQQNESSVALARRLGFKTEQPVTVLAWSVEDTHTPAGND